MHYFDSVCDVLSKVALEAKLIVVEADQNKIAYLYMNWGLQMITNVDTSLGVGVVNIDLK